MTLTNLFQIAGKSLYAPDCDTGLRPNFQPVRARAHLPTPPFQLLTKPNGGVYMHQSYLTFSSDTERKGGSLQDARNLLSLALSGLAEAADETTLQTAGAAEYFCRYDLPQYLSVLRAAMDTLDKVQQGAQAPEERS